MGTSAGKVKEIFGGFQFCRPLVLVRVETVFLKLKVLAAGLMPEVIVFCQSDLVMVIDMASATLGVSCLFF